MSRSCALAFTVHKPEKLALVSLGTSIGDGEYLLGKLFVWSLGILLDVRILVIRLPWFACGLRVATFMGSGKLVRENGCFQSQRPISNYIISTVSIPFSISACHY